MDTNPNKILFAHADIGGVGVAEIYLKTFAEVQNVLDVNREELQDMIEALQKDNNKVAVVLYLGTHRAYHECTIRLFAKALAAENEATKCFVLTRAIDRISFELREVDSIDRSNRRIKADSRTLSPFEFFDRPKGKYDGKHINWADPTNWAPPAFGPTDNPIKPTPTLRPSVALYYLNSK